MAGILIAVANCVEFVLTYVLMNLAVAFCEFVGDCAVVAIPTIDVAVFVAVNCYRSKGKNENQSIKVLHCTETFNIGLKH